MRRQTFPTSWWPCDGGDHGAVGRVLAIIRPLVVRYCRARLGRMDRSSVSADDVAQEVCLAVLTALPGLPRPGPSVPRLRVRHRVAQGDRRAPGRHPQPFGTRRGRAGLDRRSRTVPSSARCASNCPARWAGCWTRSPTSSERYWCCAWWSGCPPRRRRRPWAPPPGAVRVAQHRALARLRKIDARGGGGLSARCVAAPTAPAATPDPAARPARTNGTNGANPGDAHASDPVDEHAELDEPIDLVAVQADDELINALAAGCRCRRPGHAGYGADDRVAARAGRLEGRGRRRADPRARRRRHGRGHGRCRAAARAARARHLAPVAAAAALIVLACGGVSVGSVLRRARRRAVGASRRCSSASAPSRSRPPSGSRTTSRRRSRP